MSPDRNSSASRRAFLRTSALVSAGVLAGCSSDDQPEPTPADSPTGDQNWSEYRYDAGNTGFHPKAETPSDDVEVLWHYETQFPVLSSPVAIDGVTYFGTQDGYHVAVNARTGRRLWRHGTGDAGIPQNGSFVARGNTLYTGNGNCYKLEQATGTEQWRYNGGGNGYVTGSPKLVDGTLYLSITETLFAVDLPNREVRWRYDTGHQIKSTPAVADGRAYVASGDGSISAVDIETGESVWENTVDRPNDVQVQSPVVYDGLIYFTGPDEFLRAFDAEDGTEQWRVEETFGFRPPAVNESTVFAASPGGPLLALDAATGDRLWEYNPSEITRNIVGHVVCTDEAVIGQCPCDELIALDPADGSERWRIGVPFPNDAGQAPAVAAGTVYVSGGDGVYAVTGSS